MKIIKSLSLYPDEVRVYDSGASAEFNSAVMHQMVTCKPQRSSKCRADFRGACDKVIEAEMNRMFTEAFSIYIDELFEPEIKDGFEFFQDWSVNVYRNGSATFNHTHNEAFVTMTYYPQDCDGGEQSTFNSALLKLRTGQVVMSNPEGIPIWDRFAKEESRLHFRHLPKAGQIIVFPGYMPHWTVPGEKNTRYCLASFIVAKQKTALKMEMK